MKIAIYVLSFLVISLTVSYIKVSYRLYKVLDTVNKFFKEKENLEKIVPTVNKEDLNESRENFIKFLSDSREWAFNYIEEVQSGIKQFIKEVEPHINYYDNYGLAVEGMIQSHDDALKTVSKELKELKKLLPEQVND